MAENLREKNILDILKDEKRATVDELAERLYVSTATIRRDLTELQRAGRVRRTHGGVVYSDVADEISIYVRQTENAQEKSDAADVAMRNLPDFQTAFFDNSSTCLTLVEKMDLSHKTIVTNGIQIAVRVSRFDDVTVIIPGGEIKFNTNAVLGSMTADNLKDFTFDVAVTSCSAINSEGTYEMTLESMQIKKIAMRHSRRRVLIFDRTKIDTVNAFRTATLDEYDYLFTDATESECAPLVKDGSEIKIFHG